jgi:hypothetical glycosyl hydrolase
MIQYDYGAGEDRNWIVSETSFDVDHLGKGESILAVGNGYMGLRSSMDEAYLGQIRNWFVAGTYNKFDGHEAAELPNAADVTEMRIVLNGERFSLERGIVHSYRRNLNLKTGELVREVEWESPRGDRFQLCFRRFVSLRHLHVLGLKLEITPLSGDCVIKVTSGINGQAVNSGVQHFHEGEKRIYDKEILEFVQTTTQSQIDFVIHAAHAWKMNGADLESSPRMNIGRRKADLAFTHRIPAQSKVCLEKIVSIDTSRDLKYDVAEYSLSSLREESRDEFRAEYRKGYDRLFSDSAAAWKRYWDETDIRIESSREFDQLAVRFAQYHLLIMTPFHDSRFGIGAKGLTGEGYKGHSFWDSEIFILPYFLYHQPEIARGLLQYRYHTIEGARRKARDNGYEGAMYPWESAFTGDEETPVWGAVNILTGKATRIWSGVLEQHITADIAYAVWQYYASTGDEAFMDSYGSEMLIETAKFWASRVKWNDSKQAFCIPNIIGPDEYKEHVDDNAYTNYLAQWNIRTALAHGMELRERKPEMYDKLNRKLDIDTCMRHWPEVANHIYLPAPRVEDGIIPQDDTYLTKPVIDIAPYKNSESVQGILRDYSREQVIGMQVSKQADVVMLLYLLQNQFSDEVKRANWQYYEARTIHDSSLSMSVHSIVASQINDRDAAYRCFRIAAEIDLGPNMKSSDAGIHAASFGGAWKSVVLGFGGIRTDRDKLHVNPRLPREWSLLQFPIAWKGTRFTIELTQRHIAIAADKPSDTLYEIQVNDEAYSFRDRLSIDYAG